MANSIWGLYSGAHQLIAAGVNYLILDYLAEATMSLFAKQRAARPEGGYARDFTEGVCKEDLPLIVRSGVKIVTNAGGVNPHACRARVEELAAKAGVAVRIAVIDGDDVDRLAEFAAADVKEMFSGAAFPTRPRYRVPTPIWVPSPSRKLSAWEPIL